MWHSRLSRSELDRLAAFLALGALSTLIHALFLPANNATIRLRELYPIWVGRSVCGEINVNLLQFLPNGIHQPVELGASGLPPAGFLLAACADRKSVV